MNPVGNDHGTPSIDRFVLQQILPAALSGLGAEKLAHFGDKIEDALVSDSVVDEIGIFSKIDDPLAPEYIQVLGDISIGGFYLFSDVADGHLLFLQKAENLESDRVRHRF